MKFIIGLGNTGSHYDHTRHNCGFAMLNFLARQWDCNEWQDKPKFKAIISQAIVADEKVILAKPTTYYNLSGEAVRTIKDFYRIALTDILVIHDELALPIGTLRTRLEGSDAGNNGIKSINQHIGTGFARIRIGIANEQVAHQDAADFVLARFTHSEQQKLDELAPHVQQFAEDFIQENKQFTPTSVKK